MMIYRLSKLKLTIHFGKEFYSIRQLINIYIENAFLLRKMDQICLSHFTRPPLY